MTKVISVTDDEYDALLFALELFIENWDGEEAPAEIVSSLYSKIIGIYGERAPLTLEEGLEQAGDEMQEEEQQEEERKQGIPSPEELDDWFKSSSLKKRAFNDMIGKGWDSAKQYSFCIQESSGGNPQFWWVPQVLRKFPHPPEYDAVVRNPDGTYKSFPKGKSGKQAATNLQIIRLANILYKKGFKEESKKLMGLVND